VRRQEDQLEVQPSGSAAATARDSSATTYKLGANLQLPAGFRLYASGGTSYAYPGLYQLLFNKANQGPDLENEKSYTLQAGLTWEHEAWKARLELSRTSFQHMIYYDPTLGVLSWGYMTGAYQNGSHVRIQSAELGLGYETAAWGLDGFYRNQEARDLTQPEDKQLSAQSVIRRPFQSLGLKGYWVLGDLRFDGRWAWFGSRYEYGHPHPAGRAPAAAHPQPRGLAEPPVRLPQRRFHDLRIPGPAPHLDPGSALPFLGSRGLPCAAS
jgi:outer membrane cobalamin receptor